MVALTEILSVQRHDGVDHGDLVRTALEECSAAVVHDRTVDDRDFPAVRGDRPVLAVDDGAGFQQDRCIAGCAESTAVCAVPTAGCDRVPDQEAAVEFCQCAVIYPDGTAAFGAPVTLAVFAEDGVIHDHVGAVDIGAVVALCQQDGTAGGGCILFKERVFNENIPIRPEEDGTTAARVVVAEHRIVDLETGCLCQVDGTAFFGGVAVFQRAVVDRDAGGIFTVDDRTVANFSTGKSQVVQGEGAIVEQAEDPVGIGCSGIVGAVICHALCGSTERNVLPFRRSDGQIVIDHDLLINDKFGNIVPKGDLCGAQFARHQQCFVQGDHAVGGIDRRPFGGDSQVVFQIGQAVQGVVMDRGSHGEIFFRRAVGTVAVILPVGEPGGIDLIGHTGQGAVCERTFSGEDLFDAVAGHEEHILPDGGGCIGSRHVAIVKLFGAGGICVPGDAVIIAVIRHGRGIVIVCPGECDQQTVNVAEVAVFIEIANHFTVVVDTFHVIGQMDFREDLTAPGSGTLIQNVDRIEPLGVLIDRVVAEGHCFCGNTGVAVNIVVKCGTICRYSLCDVAVNGVVEAHRFVVGVVELDIITVCSAHCHGVQQMDRPLIVLDRSSFACIIPRRDAVDELQSPAPIHDRSTVFCPVAVEQGVEYPDVSVVAGETAAVVSGGIVDKDTVFGARVSIIVNTATPTGGVGIHDLYGVQGQVFVRIDRTAVAGDFAALKDHVLERGRCCDVENTEIAGGQRGIQYRFPVGHRDLDCHHTVVKGAAHQAAIDGDGGGDGDLTEVVAFCVFCIQRNGLIRGAPIHIFGEGNGAAAVGIGKGDRFPQRCLEVVRIDHVFQRIHHQTGVFPEQRGGTFYIVVRAVDVFGTRRTVDVLVDDRGSAFVFRSTYIVPVAVCILI